MIKKIKSLVFHPLFSGSALMIVGTNAANFIAYLYHLILGRMLGPSAYGELAAVISLIGMLSIAFSFTNLVIVKFVASTGRGGVGKLFSWFSQKSLNWGLPAALFILLFTPFLTKFLHIKYLSIVLVAPIFLFSLLTYVYKSFLQGLLRFWEIIVATNIEMLIRLALSIVFVYLGFSVFGTVAGIFLGSLGGFTLVRFFLKDVSGEARLSQLKDGKRILTYALPVLFLSLASTSFISSDVVLAKHFLNSHEAGLYASLSTLGKIIIFGTAPVTAVMFPMISQKYSKGGNYLKIFLLSLFLTGAIAFGVVILYWLAPIPAISILYGRAYLEGVPWLIWMGISMAIYSLSSLILSFYFSLEKTNVVYLAIFASLMQALGIWLFHGSILTVIKVSLGSATFLLVSLLIYFAYETKKLAYETRKPAKT